MEQLNLISRALEYSPKIVLSKITINRTKFLIEIERKPGITSKEIATKFNMPFRYVQGVMIDMRDTGYITSEPLGKLGRTLKWSITSRGRQFYKLYEQ